MREWLPYLAPARLLRNQQRKVERVMGIEPTLAAWEAAVLPLNYTRDRRGFYAASMGSANEGAGGAGNAAGPFRPARNGPGGTQVRSKRSRFITLFHALTKSCTNF